ncbi:MAG: hypothetical protein HY815_20855 [Candidatus Riflebacteria bacterium]|nr:hypothetical protein [Candidatus Riflebacteria bacterium]
MFSPSSVLTVSHPTRRLPSSFFAGFAQRGAAATSRLPPRADVRFTWAHTATYVGLTAMLVLALFSVATHHLSFVRDLVVKEDLERLLHPVKRPRVIFCDAAPVGVVFYRHFDVPQQTRATMLSRLTGTPRESTSAAGTRAAAIGRGRPDVFGASPGPDPGEPALLLSMPSTPAPFRPWVSTRQLLGEEADPGREPIVEGLRRPGSAQERSYRPLFTRRTALVP